MPPRIIQSGVIVGLLLGAFGCSNREDDCNYTLNCAGLNSDAGGNTGGSGNGGTSSGASTTGGAAACSPACTSAKPVCNVITKTCIECAADGDCSGAKAACNTSTNVCVECTKDANCSGATPACNTETSVCVRCTKDANCSGAAPLCDTAKNTCVQCKSNNDCPSATASLCSSGTCVPCVQDTDCSQITGKNVCNAGTCVQCTGSKYTACGQSASSAPLVCDSLTRTCSTKTQASAGLCQTCVSDAQCQAGEMCVNELFNANSVGYFCFYKQGATGAPADCTLTGRPYVKVVTAATSIDSQTADICSLRSSTCVALNQFSSKDCTSAGAPSDALCGFAPGVDSKCAAFGGSQNLCTVTCLSDLDCRTGVTCNLGANPPVCNFQ